MYMMTQAVKSVSHIYEATDFDQSGKAQGYSINIKRIEVISKTACQTDAKSIECDFLQPNIGVEKFLDLTSLQDHEEYCLAYMFAHRDFSDGVLGLAWIGDTVGAGGICDRYQQISGKVKSLNTGIVTNLNYGKTVAQKVTEITLAHEIGHNFGAQHDDVNSAVCSPGGVTGNYIMFPRATSGSDPNNYNFSSCSKNYIWPVIQAKSSCFEEPGTPICGNRIVEAGEQCDCGYANEQSCVDDVCCVPADGTNNGCKFSSTALTPRGSSTQVCSPSLGFCCDKTTCRPYASNNVKCADETDCSKASYCVSENYTCPAADKQPDKTKCNADSNVCINGACTGSLCLTETNKEECQCGLEADFCKVCCQTSNQTSTCAAYQNPSNDKLNLPPGSPCNQYSGYCDILYKCRQVDAEGPLSRLKKWLFSSETLDNIAEWTKEYWWACILIGLGLVLFMAGFIGCCSVHTPSSNPNKPKPRQMTLPRSLSRRNRPSAPPGASEHPPGYHTATRGGPPPYGNLPMEMR